MARAYYFFVDRMSWEMGINNLPSESDWLIGGRAPGAGEGGHRNHGIHRPVGIETWEGAN